MNKFKIIFLILFQLILYKNVVSKEDFILIQSTTSTRDSGFYEFILSNYKKVDDIKIKVIASGTGHAIENGKKCDADIILVHDKESEELFVKNGFGLYRKDLMYNDFLLIGPKKLKNNFQQKDIYEILKEIYINKFFFVSRGDNSGTHKKELKLWNQIQEMFAYKLKSLLKSEDLSVEQKSSILEYLDEETKIQLSLKKL